MRRQEYSKKVHATIRLLKQGDYIPGSVAKHLITRKRINRPLRVYRYCGHDYEHHHEAVQLINEANALGCMNLAAVLLSPQAYRCSSFSRVLASIPAAAGLRAG